MESLYELFFELSNDTRMDIIKQLSEAPMRLTELSRTLGLPAQEVSRQLSRLDKVSIIWKDVAGLYHLTPYGSHILSLLPSYSFLTENKEYFSHHSLEGIAQHFKYRIGELVGSELIDDVMMSFHYVEEAIKNSEEYIWIMSDQILLSTMPLLKERVTNGVFFRLIVPSDVVISDPVREYFLSGNHDLPRERTSTRFSDEMGIILIVSEKELALSAFPSLGGGFDYKGFRSLDPVSVEWGREVFNYIWEKSSDVIPEQIRELNR